MKTTALSLFILLACFFAVLSPTKLQALNPGDVSITMVTAPFFIADSNSPPSMDGPEAAYVGFEVCNTSGALLSDLYATLSSITGTVPGFALAGGQQASQYVGTLEIGECQTYYWYVSYPYELKDETGTFEVTLNDANPGVVVASDDVFTRNSISANAGGQVLSTTLGPGIYVGEIFYFDVEYTFGNIQNGDEFTFQPSGNLNFDASCYQLVTGEIMASDLGGVGIPAGIQNQFYFVANSNMGGSGNELTVRYYFRSLCIGTATNALPYAGQTSGNMNFKYTGNFDQNSIPIPPSTNTIVVTKTASPNFIAVPPGVVTYTITLENTSDQFVMVDRIDDVLPGTFTYNALGGGSDILASNSTILPAFGASGSIAWIGNEPEAYPYFSYLIAPMSTITLEYTVDVPVGTPNGSYQNSVTATMGTFTTPPVTASVGVGTCVVDLDCPPNISVNNDPGQCSAIVVFGPPTPSGTCAPFNIMQTAGLPSGSAFPIGDNLIEYTVTDNQGNTATCSFTVDVADSELPTINCPADFLVNTEINQCGATVNFSVTGSDNCPGEVISQVTGMASSAFFPIGIITNTFMIEDASGNTAFCSFDVEVVDNLSPQISCPSDMVIDTDPGQCGAVVTYTVPVGIDNCPNPVTMLFAGQASNTFFDIGTTTVTYMVTDASGNTAGCSFDIIIEDNELPQLSCPADITISADPGVCEADVTFSVTTSDNCPGVVLMQTAGLPSGSIFPVGTTLQTFDATDASGNKNTCSFNIIVEDNELPEITCPLDIALNVDVDECGAIVNFSIPFSDNCPGVSVMQLVGLPTGSLFPVGTTTNTFLATDASGNMASCSFDVVITDNIDPTISCPMDMVLDNDAGVCGATVNYSITNSDNCPGQTLMQTSGLASGSTFPIGTTTNCFTVTDASGNMASCCFDITINDTEDPSITCPADVSVMTDMGQCNAVVINIAAMADDNCSVASVSYTLSGATTGASPLMGINDASGTTFEVGVTTVEYLVTDASGNTLTCSFTVTVSDLNDLSIVCPMDVSVMTDMGQCNAIVGNLTPVTTDNCGIQSVTYTLSGATVGTSPGTGINDASGTTFEVGVTTVEYTATDVNGNTTSCSFTVTVEDNDGLSIVCPGNVVVSNEAGLCEATVNNLTPTVTDNCGVESVVYELSGATTASSPGTGINDASGETFNIGVTTVTYTVTDDNGNMVDCDFTVTVNDTENPTLFCVSSIVVNTIPDQCGNNVNYNVTTDDNCPGAILMQTAGLPSGAFFPVGITSNTYELTDASGNMVSCTFTVEVVDNDSPMISCPSDITADTDPGTCDAEVDYITPVGTDNCPNPVTTIFAGLPSGATFPLGLTVVTYLVTDAEGNTATCSFDVLIEDNADPVLNCPLDFAVGTDLGQCSAIVNFSVTGSDNCMGNTMIMQTMGIPTGNSYPSGMTTNVFEMTDGNGNSTSCMFTVTVSDNENPTLSCPTDFMVTSDMDQCGATVDFMIMSNDNCSGEILQQISGLPSGATFPVGTTTQVFEVTDAAGNMISCMFDVTVVDQSNPTIDCPNDITVNNTPGLCEATVNFTVDFDDNCAGTSLMQIAGLPSGSTFPVGTTTNTFQVMDAAGNSVSCSFDVTVVDNESPFIDCPSDITVNNDPDECGAIINYVVPTGTDNCPGSSVSMTTGMSSGSLFPIGTTTVTFMVTDASGNTATCSFDVTVNDDSPPTINCPGDYMVSTDPDICGAELNFPISFNDNCPGYTVLQVSMLGDGDVFPVGTTTVAYQITDASGAMTSCQFDVTVEDLTPPVIACPPAMWVFNLDPGACDGIINFNITVTDNCDPNPVIMQTAGGPLQSGDVFPIGSYPYSYMASDVSGNTSNCDFTIVVAEYPNPTGTLVCNDLITVSVDQNGIATIVADMLLEGGPYGCYDDYLIDITQLDCSFIGITTVITITDPDTGNFCTTDVNVEDNLPPTIECGPAAVTISCLDDLGSVNPPEAMDNCTAVTIEQTGMYYIDTEPCDDNMVQVVLVWVATDAYGNTSAPCEQTVTLLRPDPDMIDFPDDVEWDCSVYSAFPNVTDPSPLTGNPATTGSGIPANLGGIYCGYIYGHSDIVQELCGNTIRIIRTWTVIDECTGNTITSNSMGEDNIQIILISDTTPPVLTLGNFEVSVNVPMMGSINCNAQSYLPAPVVSDDCSNWTIQIITPVGEAIYLNGVDGSNGGLIPPPGLGLGVHNITYLATDDCGNTGQIVVQITVIDDTAPTAICDEITNVSLTSNGMAFVPAIVFDDGSYDNCSAISFQVRRLNGDCDGNYDDFGDSVKFCCSDIAQNPIMVVLQVMDAYGNTNTCMVEVEVEDKLPPILVSCPSNQTITCDLYHELYAVPLNNGDASVLDDFGQAEFYDNCEFTVEYNYSINLDNCQSGQIIRTWVASDDSPTNPSVTCTQIIFIEHVSDWGVEFPADILATCTDGQLPDFGEPNIFDDECELIGVSFEDEVFTVVPDACYKILRHYTLINWCVYDEFGYNAYIEYPESSYPTDFDQDGDSDTRTFRDGWNSNGSPGIADGYIKYTQIIKIIDDEAPIFEVEIDGCIEDTDCDTDITLPYPSIMDECSTEYTVTISGDFGTFSDITGDVIIPDVVVGLYQVQYAVTDNCGNTSFETILVEVEDCKLPTPICLFGVYIEIMQTGMIDIMASDLNLDSYDNCPGVLKFSFSPNINDNINTYTCDDIGQHPLEIWVTDASGNQDYCETFVEVQDNMGFCTGNITTVDVAGLILTEEDEGVELVMLDVNGGLQTQLTNATGAYNFEVQAGGDYSLAPMLDADPLNGVTTYDMVLISQHILGINLLDSPYQRIAADANNSGGISTLDLVAIQKLVLILEDNFPNNTSWRFVDANYVFPVPTNPWVEAFPEIISYNNLATDQLGTDFVAIKVGDVNGSAQANSYSETDNRTVFGDMILQTAEQKLKAGVPTDIWFNGSDQDILGYQFTLELDPTKVRIEEVLYEVADVVNFGERFVQSGQITVSWHDFEARFLGANEKQFGIRVMPLADVALEDVLNISSAHTRAEAYASNGDLLEVQLQIGERLAANNQYALYQNIPNPFGGRTTIGFYLPEATTARIIISDVSGRVIQEIENTYQKGYQEVELEISTGSGIYYYSLETPDFQATRKMMRR